MKLLHSFWFYILLWLICFLVIFGAVKLARAEDINWDTLIPAIIQVESSGNPNAFNKNSGAIGLMQITPIVLKEYNEINGHYVEIRTGEFNTYEDVAKKLNRITYEQLYDEYINIKIGTWYLNRIWEHYLPHYKLDQTLENLCIAYNFGIGNLVKYRQGTTKLPLETKNYIKKVNYLLRKGAK